MKTPPLLLGATLLFWGWQTGLPVFGAVLALVLEGARVAPVRWEFSQADFNRVWDLCALLFFSAVIYMFTAGEGASGVAGMFGARGNRIESMNQTTRSVLRLFQWMPLMFFPIMAAQAFSRHERINLTTFSWWLRRRDQAAVNRGARAQPRLAINIAHLYFAICLLGASAAKREPALFFASLSALLVWALWRSRSRRFSPALWGGWAAVVITTGYAAQVGLKQLQKEIERWDTAFLSRFGAQGFDPKESRTSIGAIGRIKLSGHIVLRLDPHGQAPPELLREASYNQFRAPLWFSSKKELQPVFAETNGTTWIFLPQKTSRKALTISRYLPKGAGLLATPNGVSQVEHLPVLLLETNRLGVVRVSDGPGLVSYEARYDGGPTFDGPPEKDDLEVPEVERAAVAQIAAELGLAAQTPAQRLQTLAAFFQNRFQYSTWLTAEPASPTNRTALADFLLNKRAGHCEFFATATVLLLRQAGLAARYAIGYSVQERSGRKYIVRQRHAHAWCLVHHEGVWQDFDTTPGSWNEIEHDRASFWEPLSDAWSRLWFEFSKWRWSENRFRRYALWLVAALLLALVARLFFGRRWTRFREEKTGRPAPIPAGLDSEFYLVERRLQELGLERRPGEAPVLWLQRIEPTLPAGTPPLTPLLALHYRHRFDPQGLAASERAALSASALAWLERAPKPPSLSK